MRAIGRDPLFVERGAGAELVDVDGNRYVDWVCSWGPLIHGHAHPEVVAAVSDAAAARHELRRPDRRRGRARRGGRARACPSVEMLRMTSSGTEATMSALRLARAVTGRDNVILKFAGAYHGHVDGLLAEAGSGLATQGIPASPGVPGRGRRGDGRRALERRRRRSRPLRPSTSSRRSSPSPTRRTWGSSRPRPASSSCCASAPTRPGALLIFDEVISGFRVARGGAQELTGVMPDLTIMGKVIGGGLPAAAYGGPRELMERIAPAGDVYQAGTLSGNPLAVAAGLATLRCSTRPPTRAWRRPPRRWPTGLREAAGDRPVQVVSVPGLLTVFFSAEPVRDYAGAARLRPRRLRRLVPRAAGARRLPAAVAVRGLVPVARAHRRARRAHGRGRRRGVRRAR